VSPFLLVRRPPCGRRGACGGERCRVAAGVLRVAPDGVPGPRQVPPQLVLPPCVGFAISSG
jgi:hypothetical protein